jgi:hypothetical protein
MQRQDAQGLLKELMSRHGWDADAALTLVTSYADEQDAFWAAAGAAATKPRPFAAFLAEVEARYLELVAKDAGPHHPGQEGLDVIGVDIVTADSAVYPVV